MRMRCEDEIRGPCWLTNNLLMPWVHFEKYNICFQHVALPPRQQPCVKLLRTLNIIFYLRHAHWNIIMWPNIYRPTCRAYTVHIASWPRSWLKYSYLNISLQTIMRTWGQLSVQFVKFYNDILNMSNLTDKRECKITMCDFHYENMTLNSPTTLNNYWNNTKKLYKR